MWISKNKDERRKEFINIALKLFTSKGYENTSINDILKEVKVTKGSFYHNFKSKDDLLDKVVEDLADSIKEIGNNILNQTNLSAIQKLEELYIDMIDFRKNNIELYKILYAIYIDDKNAIISKKLLRKILLDNIPIIKEIINQGIVEGTFGISNSLEASELYIRLLILCKQKISRLIATDPRMENIETKNTIISVTEFYQNTITSLLGAQKDTFKFLCI